MRAFCLSCGFTLCLALPCCAETFVVDPFGNGDYATIQQAIDAAAPGDVIELTDGTFTGDGNRDLDYHGKAVMVRSQSSDPAMCRIDCEGSESAPHRGFHFHTQETAASVLQNVTITGGYLTGWDMGGAIFCDSLSSPSIIGCHLTVNHAPGGGGVGVHWDSSPTLAGCLFAANTAQGGGALMVVDWFSAPVITDCVFADNSAGSGGAAAFDTSGPLISDCLFSGNTADDSGGAISYMECFDLPSLTNCRITNNTAGYQGGGICFYYASPTLSGCVIDGNSAGDAGGGLLVQLSYTLSVENCTLAGNAAPEGAGVAVIDTEPALQNTIIAFNHDGEAISCEATSGPTLSCCDVFGNEGGDWIGCIAGQYGVDGNIAAGPSFCAPDLGDYTLAEDSPCAPFTPPNPECGLIGAEEVACGPTSTHSATWGEIKTLFR